MSTKIDKITEEEFVSLYRNKQLFLGIDGRLYEEDGFNTFNVNSENAVLKGYGATCDVLKDINFKYKHRKFTIRFYLGPKEGKYDIFEDVYPGSYSGFYKNTFFNGCFLDKDKGVLYDFCLEKNGTRRIFAEVDGVNIRLYEIDNFISYRKNITGAAKEELLEKYEIKIKAIQEQLLAKKLLDYK